MYKCTQCGHTNGSLSCFPVYTCQRVASEEGQVERLLAICSVCQRFTNFNQLKEVGELQENVEEHNENVEARNENIEAHNENLEARNENVEARQEEPPQEPIRQTADCSVNRTNIVPTKPVMLCESYYGDGHDGQRVTGRQRIRMLENFSRSVQEQEQEQSLSFAEFFSESSDGLDDLADMMKNCSLDRPQTSGISLHKSGAMRCLRSASKTGKKPKLSNRTRLERTQKQLDELERQQLHKLARQDRVQREGQHGGEAPPLHTPLSASMWRGKELEQLFGVSPDYKETGDPRTDALLRSLLHSLQQRATDDETQPQPSGSLELSKLPQLKQLVASVSMVKRCSYQWSIHGATKTIRLMKGIGCRLLTTVETPSLGAQFCPVSYTNEELLGVLMDKYRLIVDTQPTQLMFRSDPIECPDFRCPRKCFPLDMQAHLLFDHQLLHVEHVDLRQTKTLFLDQKAARLDEATAIMLYQLRDKITACPHDFRGGSLLPVLLMAARTRLSRVFGLAESVPSNESPVLVLWLCSQRVNNMRILATLSVGTTRAHMADSLMVTTAELYDMHQPMDMANLIRSPAALIVPQAQLQQMSQRGKHMLAVQVQFH